MTKKTTTAYARYDEKRVVLCNYKLPPDKAKKPAKDLEVCVAEHGTKLNAITAALANEAGRLKRKSRKI